MYYWLVWCVLFVCIMFFHLVTMSMQIGEYLSFVQMACYHAAEGSKLAVLALMRLAVIPVVLTTGITVLYYKFYKITPNIRARFMDYFIET